MPTTGYPLGSPFGIGVPATAEDVPPGAAYSRYLNGNGNYELNPETGRYTQMPAVRQRVMFALRHLRDSSPVLPEGISYPRKMSLSFEHDMDRAIRYVLRQMTDVEKAMLVDSIQVVREGTGRANITIVYTDLQTNKQEDYTFEA